MEELQQLSLASKVPGQKMQVIVSLFSVPRKGCTCCGTTVLAGNLNGNGNSPVTSSLFRWGSFSRLLSKGQLLEQERPKRSKMFESCRAIPDSDTFPGQLLLGMLLVRRGKGWCYCCALIQPVAKGLLPVLWQDPFFSLNAEQLQFPALVVWDLTFFSSKWQKWATWLSLVFIWYQHCTDHGGKAVSVLRLWVLFNVCLLWQRLALAALGLANTGDNVLGL